MLYNSLYNSKLWKKLDSKSRNIRIIVLGTVLYVILHSFLNSNYVEGVEIITNNTRFLYYLIGIDLLAFGLRVFMDGGKKKAGKKNKGKKFIPPQLENDSSMHHIPPQILQMMAMQNQMRGGQVNLPKPGMPQFQKPNQGLQNSAGQEESYQSVSLPVYNKQAVPTQNQDQSQSDAESIPIYHSKQEQYDSL